MEIRKISIGPDYKGGAMHYLVGQKILNDTNEIHVIKFEDSTQSIKIYIINEANEILLWKEFTHTIPISIEYNITVIQTSIAIVDKAIKKQQYYADTQVGNSWLRDRAIAKAQLRKVIEEIEKVGIWSIIKYKVSETEETAFCIPEADWQAIRKEAGLEE